MGRKALFSEKEKKGPGRKAKKQGAPVFSKKLLAGKLIFQVLINYASFKVFCPMPTLIFKDFNR